MAKTINIMDKLIIDNYIVNNSAGLDGYQNISQMHSDQLCDIALCEGNPVGLLSLFAATHWNKSK